MVGKRKKSDQRNGRGWSLFRWLEGRRIFLELFTLVAAISAAVFTGWMAFRTHDLADDSAKNLESSTRAYVAVTGIEWFETPKAGTNQRLKINFENLGKEAASDFNLLAAVGPPFFFKLDDKGMPFIHAGTTQWPRVERCEINGGLNSIIAGQRPVYPGVKNSAIIYAFNLGPEFLPQRIVEGTASFYVFGCAVYWSFSKLRASPFCFYFQPARGRAPEYGSFEWCPVGSGNAT